MKKGTHCSLVKCCKSGLEGFWIRFWSCGQKCFKIASWKPPRMIFEPGARNDPKLLPGSLLELVFGIGTRHALKLFPRNHLEQLLGLMPEMLQNCFLEAFWKPPGACWEPNSPHINAFRRQNHRRLQDESQTLPNDLWVIIVLSRQLNDDVHMIWYD